MTESSIPGISSRCCIFESISKFRPDIVDHYKVLKTLGRLLVFTIISGDLNGWTRLISMRWKDLSVFLKLEDDYPNTRTR